MTIKLCLHCGGDFNTHGRRPSTGLTRGVCQRCYARAIRNGTRDQLPPAKGAYQREIGSKEVNASGYVTIKTEDGVIGEHRHVMQEHLGRKLVKGENVHHVNGDRADNRLENLELWFTAQPYGQRVSEILAYVAEHHAEAVQGAIAARNGL